MRPGDRGADADGRGDGNSSGMIAGMNGGRPAVGQGWTTTTRPLHSADMEEIDCRRLEQQQQQQQQRNDAEDDGRLELDRAESGRAGPGWAGRPDLHDTTTSNKTTRRVELATTVPNFSFVLSCRQLD